MPDTLTLIFQIPQFSYVVFSTFTYSSTWISYGSEIREKSTVWNRSKSTIYGRNSCGIITDVELLRRISSILCSGIKAPTKMVTSILLVLLCFLDLSLLSRNESFIYRLILPYHPAILQILQLHLQWKPPKMARELGTVRQMPQEFLNWLKLQCQL